MHLIPGRELTSVILSGDPPGIGTPPTYAQYAVINHDPSPLAIAVMFTFRIPEEPCSVPCDGLKLGCHSGRNRYDH